MCNFFYLFFIFFSIRGILCGSVDPELSRVLTKINLISKYIKSIYPQPRPWASLSFKYCQLIRNSISLLFYPFHNYPHGIHTDVCLSVALLDLDTIACFNFSSPFVNSKNFHLAKIIRYVKDCCCPRHWTIATLRPASSTTFVSQYMLFGWGCTFF